MCYQYAVSHHSFSNQNGLNHIQITIVRCFSMEMSNKVRYSVDKSAKTFEILFFTTEAEVVLPSLPELYWDWYLPIQSTLIAIEHRVARNNVAQVQVGLKPISDSLVFCAGAGL